MKKAILLIILGLATIKASSQTRYETAVHYNKVISGYLIEKTNGYIAKEGDQKELGYLTYIVTADHYRKDIIRVLINVFVNSYSDISYSSEFRSLPDNEKQAAQLQIKDFDGGEPYLFNIIIDDGIIAIFRKETK
jgi:hypothetical protein